MDTTTIVAFVIGALTAALPLLVFVSAKTKNTIDDTIVAYLKKALELYPNKEVEAKVAKAEEAKALK